MTDCEQIRPLIETWLDGELSLPESERVREHVSACGACAEVQRHRAEIDAAFRGYVAAEAGKIRFGQFWHALEQRIQTRAPWYEHWFERAAGWVYSPRAAWAVPAAIALAVVILSYEAFLPAVRPRANVATVDSIDSHGRNVALWREDDSKTTVIWLFQNQEDDDEAAEEPPQPGPAF